MRTTATPDGERLRPERQQDVHHQRPGRRRVPGLREDRSRRARAARGLATFIVERGMPGVTVGPPFKKMGMRDSPTSEVFFDDVKLGVEHLLGGKEKGQRRAQRTPRTASATSAPACPSMAWGIIERCYDASLAVRARAQAVRPRDRRVPGGAAQDRRPVPEAAHRREHRVPARVDAAERRARHAVHQRARRRCARSSRSTPR